MGRDIVWSFPNLHDGTHFFHRCLKKKKKNTWSWEIMESSITKKKKSWKKKTRLMLPDWWTHGAARRVACTEGTWKLNDPFLIPFLHISATWLFLSFILNNKLVISPYRHHYMYSVPGTCRRMEHHFICYSYSPQCFKWSSTSSQQSLNYPRHCVEPSQSSFSLESTE